MLNLVLIILFAILANFIKIIFFLIFIKVNKDFFE